MMKKKINWKKEFDWIKKQRDKADKVYCPKMYYDKKYDILYINWLPKLKYEYSIETNNGFVFDIAKKQIKGIEIFNFMKKIKKDVKSTISEPSKKSHSP